ncbi:hypothetical protein IAR50_001954 [Cryptococcus sp. DSM 104548]
MNTAGSVAYGWGVLVVAAGVSFYWAKKEIDGRRRDAQLKGTRSLEKLTWEERIAKDEAGKSKVVDALKGTNDKPAGGAPP